MLRRHARTTIPLALLLLPLVTPAWGDPLNSDLATYLLGGGCYPTGKAPAILDMLVLINPEWAPIAHDPMGVGSDPVLLHGTVDAVHGETSGDFPSTHLRSDVVTDVLLDPSDQDRAATGNDGTGVIAFEWEAGAYPTWAWPGEGDRIVGLGRYIFDCGHTGARDGMCSATTARPCFLDGDCRPTMCPTCAADETCVGAHFGYSSELHPPHATAVIRRGRGGKLSAKRNARAVPVTRADVYVSADGGGAGDECVLTHLQSELNQLTVECWPLAHPLARLNTQDFVFDLPLPPRPAGARPRWRVARLERRSRDVVPARVRILRVLDGTDPHLEVHVLMTKKVGKRLPNHFAGTILAGWQRKTTTLTHVRLTIDGIVVNSDLQRATPAVPRTCSVSDTIPCATTADCPAGEMCFGLGPVQGWLGQAAVNGEWQQFTGLGNVATGDRVPQTLVFDQYLPGDGALRLRADATGRDCIDAMYGKSLATGLVELGFVKGGKCLLTSAHPAGKIDVTYTAPDFGAASASMPYETTSTGGQGGHCSLTTGVQCVVDADCGAESCVTTGGAFTLRYHVERVP